MFGTTQADALKSHWHATDFYVSPPRVGGTAEAAKYLRSALHPVQDRQDYVGPRQDHSSTDATGSTETRPRNVALLACIKF